MIHHVLYFYIMVCLAVTIFNLSYIVKQRVTQWHKPHLFDQWKKSPNRRRGKVVCNYSLPFYNSPS